MRPPLRHAMSASWRAHSPAPALLTLRLLARRAESWSTALMDDTMLSCLEVAREEGAEAASALFALPTVPGVPWQPLPTEAVLPLAVDGCVGAGTVRAA